MKPLFGSVSISCPFAVQVGDKLGLCPTSLKFVTAYVSRHHPSPLIQEAVQALQLQYIDTQSKLFLSLKDSMIASFAFGVGFLMDSESAQQRHF